MLGRRAGWEVATLGLEDTLRIRKEADLPTGAYERTDLPSGCLFSEMAQFIEFARWREWTVISWCA